MTILTIEGVVKNGQIQLSDNMILPEDTKVYVIIPDVKPYPQVHIYSPRLAHPEQAADFTKQVLQVDTDASL